MNPRIDERTKSRRPYRMAADRTPAVVSIVGRSNSGKTTFAVKLISELTARGFRVGTIKHDVHGFEMDRPGKDSWRHKQAGALATIVSSPNRIGMVKDVEYDHPPEALISLLPGMDIILTEGYKRGNLPKLEVFRGEIHRIPFCKGDPTLLALISDDPIDLGVPRFFPGAVEAAADFLVAVFGLEQETLALNTQTG